MFSTKQHFVQRQFIYDVIWPIKNENKLSKLICNVHMQALLRKLDVVLVQILPYN